MSLLTYRSAPVLPWQALASLPAAGLILGLIGPFGSYVSMPLAGRVAHFITCVTLVGGCALVVSYLVARRFFHGNWPLWAALCTDLVLAVPGAVIVYFSLGLFASGSLPHVQPVNLVWQNLLLTLIFRGISLMMSWRRVRDRVPDQPAEEPAAVPALNARLPRELRAAPVLALSSEDHYLRVHTHRGEALIHMTIAQAVTLLPNGFQIHRSHWVSASAIRSTGNGKVILVTGLTLPLSRHRRKAFDTWRQNALVQTAA